MFASEFQGGPCVEVFTAQGSNPTSKWKVTGKPKKIYDKDVKSYVYELENSAKLQVPMNDRQFLGLNQPFLVLQLYVTPGKNFALELAILDLQRKRRRIGCSSGTRETVCKDTHARLPIGPMVKGGWLNLCIDLRNIVGHLWPGAEYLSLELIQISANCKLRKVATMRGSPADSTNDDVVLGCDRTLWQSTPVEPLQQQWNFVGDMQPVTQVLHMHKILAWEAQERGEPYLAGSAAGGGAALPGEAPPWSSGPPTGRGGGRGGALSGTGKKDDAGPTVLAFGRRVPLAKTSGPQPGTRDRPSGGQPASRGAPGTAKSAPRTAPTGMLAQEQQQQQRGQTSQSHRGLSSRTLDSNPYGSRAPSRGDHTLARTVGGGTQAGTPGGTPPRWESPAPGWRGRSREPEPEPAPQQAPASAAAMAARAHREASALQAERQARGQRAAPRSGPARGG
jgi:hypothetical protein